MNEKMLWEKFCENGKIEDYLNYRRAVNSIGKTELEPSDKNNSTGVSNKRTEYR